MPDLPVHRRADIVEPQNESCSHECSHQGSETEPTSLRMESRGPGLSSGCPLIYASGCTLCQHFGSRCLQVGLALAARMPAPSRLNNGFQRRVGRLPLQKLASTL